MSCLDSLLYVRQLPIVFPKTQYAKYVQRGSKRRAELTCETPDETNSKSTPVLQLEEKREKQIREKEKTFELLTCGLSRAEPHQAQLDFLDLPAPRDVSAPMAGSRCHGAPVRRVVSLGFLLLS